MELPATASDRPVETNNVLARRIPTEIFDERNVDLVIEEGDITEAWHDVDTLGLLLQLGAIQEV